LLGAYSPEIEYSPIYAGLRIFCVVNSNRDYLGNLMGKEKVPSLPFYVINQILISGQKKSKKL